MNSKKPEIALKQFGIEPDSYIGLPGLSYIHPEDVKQVQESFYEVFEKNNIIFMEYRWRVGSQGDWIDVDARGTPIVEDDQVTKVVVVSRDITDRKRMEQKLKYMSQIDGLTGIANRRLFDKTLDEEWENSLRNSTSLSLLLLDID